MNYKDKVTIILTLKGRKNFTIRYLTYLNEIQFPYKVLLADGGDVNLEFQNFLENKNNFPNVDYQYIRYPEDNSLTTFYQKVSSVLQLVKTPYIMFNDNDDFPLPNGIAKSIEFLEKNKDYSAAGGRVAGVSYEINALGQENCRWHKYYDDGELLPNGLEKNNAIDRIKCQIVSHKSYSCYYHIIKTDSIRHIYDYILKYKLDCLTLHERFIIQSLLVFGKMKTFDDFYTYVRQRNTSEGAASVSHFAKSLYLNNWMDKFDRYIVALSSLMLSVDQKQDQEIIALKIRNFYVTYEMNKDTPFTTKEKINLLANHVVSFIDNKTRFRKEIPYYRKVTSYILFNITLYKRNSSDRFFYKKISDLITQKFNFF